MTQSVTSYLRFIRAGLLNQGQMGAIVPSQRVLIGKMLAPVPRDYRGRVVELGAGTGALTLRLAARCPQAQILACEINPLLAREARRNLAAAGQQGRARLVCAPAQRLLGDLAEAGPDRPDFIFSGIPLANLDRNRVAGLIRMIWRALAPGGLYIQFQHSLIDRRKIKAVFQKLRTVPVLLNFPPAFVYYAQK